MTQAPAANPAPSATRTAVKLTGVTSCAVLSLLMNPLFVAPVVAVSALLMGRRGRGRSGEGAGAAEERRPLTGGEAGIPSSPETHRG